jgi:hypothetical protein
MRRFLGTLRRSGNLESVTAVTYGLYPGERRQLALLPNVRVVEGRHDGHPAQLRLRDFQAVIEQWPADTPVAYWDAADVLFQAPLAPLWELVQQFPDRLLAATEGIVFAESDGVREWAETITDTSSRASALELLTRSPVINAGFAAGTARAMLRYLRATHDILHSPAFYGSTDWGDQTAMNLYCHSHPDAWQEISDAWNYCLCGHGPRDYRIDLSGRSERLDGHPLYVVHGNGHKLDPWNLVHLTA